MDKSKDSTGSEVIIKNMLSLQQGLQMAGLNDNTIDTVMDDELL